MRFRGIFFCSFFSLLLPPPCSSYYSAMILLSPTPFTFSSLFTLSPAFSFLLLFLLFLVQLLQKHMLKRLYLSCIKFLLSLFQNSVRHICVGLFLGPLFDSVDLCVNFSANITLLLILLIYNRP